MLHKINKAQIEENRFNVLFIQSISRKKSILKMNERNNRLR